MYFNEPDVHAGFIAVSNDFRSELLRQFKEYKPGSTPDQEKEITDAYDEVIRFELRAIENGVSNFVTKYVEQIREKLDGEIAQWAKETIEIAQSFETMAEAAHVDTTGFDGFDIVSTTT